MLETVLAIPYHYKRNGICYLRLRPRGATPDSFSISLRTADGALALLITTDILKKLSEFHFRKPAASWEQLKTQAVEISLRCLSAVHGDVSTEAYRAGRARSSSTDKESPTTAPRKSFYFTPRGIVEPDCAIQKPDYGNPAKGFGNPRGLWRANLTVPGEDAQPLVEEIVQEHEANYAKLLSDHEKNPPVLPHGRKALLPYEGDMPFVINDDGSVTFRIKRYASYIDRHTQENKPHPLEVVDSKGKRIDNVPAIAGGSELKVKLSMFPYGWTAVAGASVILQLDSVMLIRLVEPGGADSDDGWPSEAVDGGYEAS
ncbi:DUF2815 family protein [Pseudomonas sp. HY7a-MNA-CIBAN-0227]|uniref:DUF2815 family protein n=1 Tax=Pseudomonas sp. HY7a-MNA-CIBAN-0227 TaxID=3140474 RepID=UPI003332DF48